MTHMLCELLAQALGQINSVATRLTARLPGLSRQLRTLILTLPSAMPETGARDFPSPHVRSHRHRLESDGLAPAG